MKAPTGTWAPIRLANGQKVKMESADEVVVVGYGSQSKRNVTGSIARVNMSTVQDLPNTNITQAVRGRLAGFIFTDNGRPGQNGTLLIRGPRSLLAGNNPLIVLDGIFFMAACLILTRMNMPCRKVSIKY